MKKKNLSIFIALILVGICTISSKAISPEESTSADYLKNHGYSPEMARLVTMQKDRIDEKGSTTAEKPAVWYDKPVKTIKYWFKTSDWTMSPDFGNNKIKF